MAAVCSEVFALMRARGAQPDFTRPPHGSPPHGALTSSQTWLGSPQNREAPHSSPVWAPSDGRWDIVTDHRETALPGGRKPAWGDVSVALWGPCGQGSCWNCCQPVASVVPGLTSLRGFNLDISRTWLTPPPGSGQGPHVQEVQLHQDKGNSQTCGRSFLLTHRSGPWAHTQAGKCGGNPEAPLPLAGAPLAGPHYVAGLGGSPLPGFTFLICRMGAGGHVAPGWRGPNAKGGPHRRVGGARGRGAVPSPGFRSFFCLLSRGASGFACLDSAGPIRARRLLRGLQKAVWPGLGGLFRAGPGPPWLFFPSTRLLVTGPWKQRGAGHFHSCTLGRDDQILCQPLKHVPTPRGSRPLLSMARDPDGTLVVSVQDGVQPALGARPPQDGSLCCFHAGQRALPPPCRAEGTAAPRAGQRALPPPCRAEGTAAPVCVQVKRRRSPQSLAQELNGACSLLGADLGLRDCFGFPGTGAGEPWAGPEVGATGASSLFPKEASDGRPGRSCLTLEPAASSPPQDPPDLPGARPKHEGSIRERRSLEDEDEEEEEAGTEIAIVLDGSGSIDPPDFQRAKAFIYNMMQNFYEKCFKCRFALVQYGEVIQTELELEDSEDASAALWRVQNIVQVGKVTKTASAIQHVLDSVFVPSRGSREKAPKIMVVLTDGDIFQDPLDLASVLHSSRMRGIERFAIGVGAAFNQSKANQELHLIASDPDEAHAFKVTDYSALDGLLSSLEQKILRVEGTVGEALQYELAQIGFSAHVLGKQQVLLGAVGAFDWSGGVVLYHTENHQFHFLNESTRESRTAQYGYLGYSLAVVNTSGGTSYLAGAPRHGHRGKVLSVPKDRLGLGFRPILEGEQMGSYFGSELCPLDVDMDGTTDHLLVGAPFYHLRGEEGRVYVYRLGGQGDAFTLVASLQGRPQFAFARFGFAVAAVGDLDQDGLGDVAIGAPLEGFPEDAGFGSVYIYNGRPGGVSSSPSQWVRAAELAPGLQYFGASIAGGIDLTGDGLGDVSAGSLGRAAVLRSRPVVRLQTSMVFTPPSVKPGPHREVEARLCFKIPSGGPLARTGPPELSLNATIELDVKKERKRLVFRDGGARSQLARRVPGCHQLVLSLQEGEAPAWQWLPGRVPNGILGGSRKEDVGGMAKEGFLGALWRERGGGETSDKRPPRAAGDPRLGAGGAPSPSRACDDHDCFSNIGVEVSYQLRSLEGPREQPQPILGRRGEAAAYFELPYEKDCKNKLTCVAEFELATELSPGQAVVGLTKEVTLTVHLANTGEESYMTRMLLTHPSNLQLKKVQQVSPGREAGLERALFLRKEENSLPLLAEFWNADRSRGGPHHADHQALGSGGRRRGSPSLPADDAACPFLCQQPSSATEVQCTDPTPAPPGLAMTCKVGHFVFKRSHANFSITWQLEESKFPNETAEIAIMVTNANGQPPLSERLKLPVKHALAVVLDKPPVMYVDTGRSLWEHQELQFNVRGENPFGAELELQICVPAKRGGRDVMKLKNITAMQVPKGYPRHSQGGHSGRAAQRRGPP
ncbi:integrin alpha-E [Gracilinanus agilis]|uniref:integrin alpha-E n=1 Tax=Gracilinanus agilis TaxID=191870 RepID=UPI001CFF23E6|nr:integrin alpha-E [Gracilinanus agilis]